MKTAILSSHQMKLVENKACIGKTTSFMLMQRAGKAVADEIIGRYAKQPVLVLCGSGNNGGDGFIAAASLLKKKWPVTLACAVDPHDLQGDASRAAGGWSGDAIPFDALEIPEEGLIVDAVFGTGLARPVTGQIGDLLMSLRASECPVIAIDVPSGLHADTGECQPCTPQAELTVTFFRKKPAHILYPGKMACGEVVVVDIGIEEEALAELGPFIHENDPSLDWGELCEDKSAYAHKYDHGHVVTLGGKTMTGAASLASVAALRMGAGLSTIVTGAESAALYRTLCPSVIVETYPDMARFKEHIKDPHRNVVVIGPGAGLEHPAALKKAVFDSVQNDDDKICILDADALTVFADDPQILHKVLGANCILTPHEGEFARIFPNIKGSKIERAYEAARRTGAVIVLKGPDTVIAAPHDRLVINGTGTGWLATAGSGDVLAGMIAGLCARSIMVPFDAACAAVWMHGKAAEKLGAGMISADLSGVIPAIWRDMLTLGTDQDAGDVADERDAA